MIDLDVIRAARERITEHILETPCVESTLLSERCGARILLKCETMQITGSFKPRGAVNRLLSLSAEELAHGVVAASAGNHAQGVAYAGGRLGISSRIVMPELTPAIKVKRTRALGGDIELHGDSFDEAYSRALELQDLEGRVFVSPFDDEAVVAGQGSVGLEIHEQVEDIDAVIVPVGGGGLIAGLSCALKELRPAVRIYGVQTEAAPAMRDSFRNQELTPTPSGTSIADGIAVKKPGAIPFDSIQRYVDDIVLVSESEIEASIFELLESGKLVTEGAGAAGFAAALHDRIPGLAGGHVVVVLSGGNIDLNLLNRIVEKSLFQESRLVRLEVLIKDRPGSLAALLAEVAAQEANVLEVEHARTFADVHSSETEVELTLETRDEAHADRIVAGLEERGFGRARRLSVRLGSKHESTT